MPPHNPYPRNPYILRPERWKRPPLMRPQGYVEAVARAIYDKGHMVEWRTSRLLIDGIDSGFSSIGSGKSIGGITGWRGRVLSADPDKAAEALLERHEVKIGKMILDKKRNQAKCS